MRSGRRRSAATRASSTTRPTSARALRTTRGRRPGGPCTASAASSPVDLSRFGAAPAWSLGVEEELMLVDAETLEPAPDGFSRAFGDATERIKPELFESFVEITTPV